MCYFILLIFTIISLVLIILITFSSLNDIDLYQSNTYNKNFSLLYFFMYDSLINTIIKIFIILFFIIIIIMGSLNIYKY